MSGSTESALATRLKLVVVMLCWGLSFIAIKVALRAYSPVSMVAIRLFLATLSLALIAFMKGEFARRPKGRDMVRLMGLGFLNPFLAFLLESHGMTETSASLASILMSTVPLLTPVAAFVAWRQRLGARNLIGLAVSFGGLALVFLSGSGPAEASLRGIALLSLAVLTALVYGIAAKNLLARLSPLTIVLYQQAFGFLFYLPLFFAFTDRSILPPGGAGAGGLAAILFLAVFPSALAYTLYVSAIERIGPSRSNAFINLAPVVSGLASFILLGEPLGPAKAAGIAVTVLGVYLSQGEGGERRGSSS